jgi:hypothetical protein
VAKIKKFTWSQITKLKKCAEKLKSNKNFKQIILKIGVLFNERITMAILVRRILWHEPQASGVIYSSEYSHYPRIEYYTFSTTTVKRN